MNDHPVEALSDTHFECPICGNILTSEPPSPRFDVPCFDCGYRLWCRRRLPTERIELEVLPVRVPEPWEVDQLTNALLGQTSSQRVMIDLSRLEMVDSLLVARLVTMNRRIQESGRQLTLTGMCKVVREVFAQLHLDRVFDIVEEKK
jgi:ABC-type transporter Mla MlaB component